MENSLVIAFSYSCKFCIKHFHVLSIICPYEYHLSSLYVPCKTEIWHQLGYEISVELMSTRELIINPRSLLPL